MGLCLSIERQGQRLLTLMALVVLIARLFGQMEVRGKKNPSR